MRGRLTSPALAPALALFSLTLFTPQAFGQAATDGATTNTTTAEAGSENYTAAFFAQYTPQNAYDMVQRLPGFMFDEGESARGFGGTAGNVLIDGARPTSKSGGLVEALRRIPAAQVERIELQRGAFAAGEAAGQSVVANVVRFKDKSSGTWALEMRRVGNNKILPMVDATFTTNIGAWDTSFQLDTFLLSTNRDAVISKRDATGALTSRTTEDRQEEERFGALSFDAGRDAFGGRLQLNGRLKFFRWAGDTKRRNRGLGELDGPTLDRFDNRHVEEEYGGELGADWSRTYASGWKWRLIGLGTYEQETNTDDFSFKMPVSTLLELGNIHEVEKETETILRTTFGQTEGNIKPEFGIEGAFNRLDTSIEIAIEDGAGQPTEVLPKNTVRVQEVRAEAFGNLVWQASSKLTADAGLKAEVSRISTRGGNAQTFKFLKPSAGLTYTVSDHLRLGLKAERSVGQLDFSDFAASADAIDDRVFAGNPDLRPDRTDRLEAKIDYTFGERGAISTTLFYEWKDDVLERTILESGGEALANIGSAKRWGLNANANLPLDFMLKGGLLEVDVYLKESDFLDPITGKTRRIHDFVPSEFYIDFRHDIPNSNWAWGLEYNSTHNWHGYFIDEFEEFSPKANYNAFVETTQFFGVKTTLLFYDITGGEYNRMRHFYDPNRGGVKVGTALSERRRDMGIKLVISGQF
ncbi:TonB-dependent receptor plug domain-containing protein [Kordiimonas sp.]|uniref:TonB-dependent receptor plug domain-containing protein n=1 Tax=Kordiimonas sp. TaxID=1970157 RepID=UPI003A8D444F